MAEPTWLQTFEELVDMCEPGSDQILEGLLAADEVLSAGFEQNFYNQVDENGEAWPPRKDNLPHPLLIKTGRMFRAATDTSDPGHFTEVEGAMLESGISGVVVPYAGFHHNGTSRMPARRVIYATPETVDRMVEAFADAVDEPL